MLIHVYNVEVLNNPAPYTSRLQFQVSFDCLEPGIKEELEWKLVFMGTGQNPSLDQELDSIMVGPVKVGRNKFVFDAPAPDTSLIPNEDLVDMTGLMIVGSYLNRIFIRIGYYVRAEFTYPLPVGADGKPVYPAVINPEHLIRHIAAEKPRVTRYLIPWDDDTDEMVVIENNTDTQQYQATTDEDDDAFRDLVLGDYEEDDEMSDDEEVEIDLMDE